MKRKYYINNAEFYAGVVEWIKGGRKLPITDFLIECIEEIIGRISTKRSFRGYAFLEDMQSEATLHCLKALLNYKIEKDNPYGYFTTVIHNAFVQQIKKEKKFVDFKFHIVQDEIEDGVHLDRSTIVGYNRDCNGNSIDENGKILTPVEELRKKRLY